jgi:hypothetical protein
MISLNERLPFGSENIALSEIQFVFYIAMSDNLA